MLALKYSVLWYDSLWISGKKGREGGKKGREGGRKEEKGGWN